MVRFFCANIVNPDVSCRDKRVIKEIMNGRGHAIDISETTLSFVNAQSFAYRR